MEYSTFQNKGFYIAKSYYAKLTIDERINIIANTFGCETGNVNTRPCTGKWRGQSDISLNLDNGTSLWIGTYPTPQAKSKKTINECVNYALAAYNPLIVKEAKERATAALLKREHADNDVAEQRGLKPYTFLTVEMSNGSGAKSSSYLGWYYATLAVGDNIFAILETSLNSDIARGVLSEQITRPNYFVAGGLRDEDADFAFNNVGHSSHQDSYRIPLTNGDRFHAEQALSKRILDDSSSAIANRHPDLAQKLMREIRPAERKETIKTEKESLLGELANTKAILSERTAANTGERAAQRQSSEGTR